MSQTTADRGTGEVDGSLTEALLKTRKFVSRQEVSGDTRYIYKHGGRQADNFYRERWSHDKVVRSTHGVNCTGSCSWKVYVKDGIITWETQETDYPSVGPDSPEYEPRGCPRGASFSWYTYSPTRVRYPYARSELLAMYREAKARLGDPVLAFAEISEDPQKRRHYQSVRGLGGLVRTSWEESLEIVAAAQVNAIKKYGPDRIGGFSPIPAMSIASHAIGARYTSLLGGSMISFYDWYADLPVASPQIWGDQTDVPESADWWNSSYMIMWGSNIPMTRTPDAHFMTESRYNGSKIVVVSPDYADNTKFADTWLPAAPGTDGAMAMAMGHVILKEFYLDRQVPRFVEYSKQYSDLPNLVTLRETEPGMFVPDKFVTAADLGDDSEGSKFKTVVLDETTGQPAVPNGSLGFRFTDSGVGKWNLDLGEIDPQLGIKGDATALINMPRFDINDGENEGGSTMRRGVPVTEVAGKLVTTVYDLLLATYGVKRDGLPGDWPESYEDVSQPYTPAWQEEITSVPAKSIIKVAREFADNAEKSGGRSMITLGAGTNHWFHSDETYRAIIALVTLTGCQGVNGGGWAHYVGQEKCRPVTGWGQLAGAADWARPPRQMAGTSYWYTHTDQFRYDNLSADELASPLGQGLFKDMSIGDCLAKAVRMGWTPSYPQFNRNPLDICDQAEAAGQEVPAYVVDQLKSGELEFAIDDPDAEENWPRVLTVWRANLLGSSSKGNEYFLKHLLGTNNQLAADETPPELRSKTIKWRDDAPIGKLDLLVSLDFRMTSTGIFSDVLLPAATWYEKEDLSTTDMHPFIHAFTPAIKPPWETKSDYDTFVELAKVFSRHAKHHLGVRKDLVAVPLQHDTPGETAQPGGVALDWKEGECEPKPGVTMPNMVVVERDYGAVAAKLTALGPNVEKLGTQVKGITVKPVQEVERLKDINGTVQGGVADGRPLLMTAEQACETILALSGTTNGRVAVEGFEFLEKRTGHELADLARDHEGKQIRFADTQSRPQPVITSHEWSGSEHGGRRYSPFTINVERLKPWHTLTGRQHYFLDHDWMAELGENLPAYRPPLQMRRIFGSPGTGESDNVEVTVRYLTPHSKWSIHSEYQDNLFMLALSRGGPEIWMSKEDAAKAGIKDNDWIESSNRNGVVVARAIVSHRMPEGTVYMYHAKDRLINVPKAEKSGKRGGIHNSLTRVLMKPSHFIGGYAQLSYAFNYIGPTGNQRDEITVIRRRSQEVEF